MSYVKFPGLVFRAELSTLFEYLLNSSVVLFIPVKLGLHHEDRDVLVESRIIFLQGRVDGLRVTSNTGILNCFSLLSEGVDMVRSQRFKFAEGFLLVGLIENEIFEEVKISLREALICKMGVLSENISCHVEVRVFAVEED